MNREEEQTEKKGHLWKTRLVFVSVLEVKRLASTLQLGQKTRLLSRLSMELEASVMAMERRGIE
jgi:hypothetical protein